MANPLRALIVEDNEDDALLIARRLRRGGYEVYYERVDSAAGMAEALKKEWDIVISDYSMPGFDGLEALRLAQKLAGHLPFIIISGTIGEETAVAAMRAGAHDYLMKDALARLVPAVKREIREAKNRREARREHEALQQSEAQKKAILDGIKTFIVFLDSELKILWANESAVEISGMSVEQVLGQFCYKIHWQTDERCVDCPVVRAFETGVFQTGTVIGPGNCIWDVSGSPVTDEKGEIVGVVEISRDITARVEGERELEKLIIALEQKNSELERFAYTASHDLRSPLITIKGFLGLLEQDAAEGKHEQLRSDVNTIVEAVDRMDRLLKELLELSRVGRIGTPSEMVSMDEVVKEARALASGEIEKYNSRVTIASDLPVVWGDRNRLVELVQNLLSNSAKYMGSQRRPEIHVGCEQRDGSQVFYVRDNGIGIEPRYHEKVFGLFNQLDPASEGTGVGLTLVKRIVEIHNGKIWIESEGNNQGSTFYFSLPTEPPGDGGLAVDVKSSG
ncbi:MAG: response regulator [Sedimentisphaerales bacterium]|nr:response regulator [Sedimentisphaerales bacterium]